MPKRQSGKGGTHRTGRVLTRSMHQTGKTNIGIDRKRDTMYPGKRMSRKGKIYWEFRKNRTDLSKTQRL